VAVFGLASVACAAAPSQAALIAARLAQGIGAALTQPLALAHATAIMPPERRGWVIGVLAGRRPEVAGAMVALVAIQGAVLGVTVYVVLFLQDGLGLTALQAGAVLLPAMIWSALLSAYTGRLADRHGERSLVGFGW
jgi:MFS family permease